ncbi:uncharacterized protein LOC120660803 [Panicum virgatum]|uniref:Uncharacterized protein n=1 Tax=Panicum virgatum TaxID=38727 RepID=A0A8T0VS50_PANVG|nr:uncharacterized protein LOC120660803 [Panicum virgatum]KAG2635303.1 hypothetical protein PVAP13_2NG345700 [Panicum virgatum]
MSSPSPPSSAHFATGLRPAPAGARSYPIGSAAYFSAVSLRGLLLHPSASRVPSVSFRQWPSPLAGRSRLPSAARSSGDPGEINVDDVEGTGEPLGSSTGSGKNGKESTKSFSSKELLEKLKRYGAAGVLSYGLLNTVYYVTAFLLVWFYFAPAPGRMGYGAAVERFVKLMAMVWAGSQVTKILRAGGALALAPFVDRGLRWFTVKFNFKSEGRAFATVVGFCFAIAAALFFGLTVLWA